MTQKTKVFRLFTSELLDHEGNPNGIHIGCDDLQVCKQSHIENKTSQSIQEWVAVEELHATLISREEEIETHSAAVYECTQLLSEVRAQRDALQKENEELKNYVAQHTNRLHRLASLVRAQNELLTPTNIHRLKNNTQP